MFFAKVLPVILAGFGIELQKCKDQWFQLDFILRDVEMSFGGLESRLDNRKMELETQGLRGKEDWLGTLEAGNKLGKMEQDKGLAL